MLLVSSQSYGLLADLGARLYSADSSALYARAQTCAHAVHFMHVLCPTQMMRRQVPVHCRGSAARNAGRAVLRRRPASCPDCPSNKENKNMSIWAAGRAYADELLQMMLAGLGSHLRRKITRRFVGRQVRAYADELLQTMLAELGSPAANAGPPAGTPTTPLRTPTGGPRAAPQQTLLGNDRASAEARRTPDVAPPAQAADGPRLGLRVGLGQEADARLRMEVDALLGDVCLAGMAGRAGATLTLNPSTAAEAADALLDTLEAVTAVAGGLAGGAREGAAAGCHGRNGGTSCARGPHWQRQHRPGAGCRGRGSRSGCHIWRSWGCVCGSCRVAH